MFIKFHRLFRFILYNNLNIRVTRLQDFSSIRKYNHIFCILFNEYICTKNNNETGY